MKDWQKVPKPERVAKLDVDERGYPIFYAIEPPPGSELDFRVLNMAHHLEIAMRNLCAICGEKNDYWLNFIGGPMCVKGRGGDRMREHLAHLKEGEPFVPPSISTDIFGVFGDGPMHFECANYALQVCPFLTIPKMRYSETPSKKVPNTMMDANVITNKPVYSIVYRTRSYRLIRAPGGKPVYQTAKALTIDWRSSDGTPATVAAAYSAKKPVMGR